MAAGEAIFALGLGHRRQHPAAGGLLQRHRPQAHLRAGQPLRAGGFRLFSRPDRPHDAGRRGCRHRDERHLRPRRAETRLPCPATVPDYTKSLNRDIKGMRLGIPKEYFVEGMQREVFLRHEYGHLPKLEELGANIDRDVSLPSTPYALAVYYIIAPSRLRPTWRGTTASSTAFLTRAATACGRPWRRRGSSASGRRSSGASCWGLTRFSAGYYDAYYLKAQKVRTLIRTRVRRRFREVRRSHHAHLAHRAFQGGREGGRPAGDVPLATSARCPSTSRGCRPFPFRRGLRADCPSACR